MESEKIPFNLPYLTGKELIYMKETHLNGHLAGSGPFTKKCQEWLEYSIGCSKALLTHSCTAALEMTALLLDIKPGDEIIMPSFTFVSTANAFVLFGGVPVFVDIREDTLNLNEKLIENAITPKTKAIVAVHYAGIACEMDLIMEIANRHGLLVIEDTAQGILSSYKGLPLGSIGHFGALSFHETKNIISGEGGALLVNEPILAHRAEIIWEKGTDRSRFSRGEIAKYTWQDVGSSYLLGEQTAAFLWAQFQEAVQITSNRLVAWNKYHELLAPLESSGLIRRPIIPGECTSNGHIYYVLLAPGTDRRIVLSKLKESGVNAVFHYVPLHSSPGGLKYGRISGNMIMTNLQSERLIRLPLWIGISEIQQKKVVQSLINAMS